MSEIDMLDPKTLARDAYAIELDWMIGERDRVDVEEPRDSAAQKLAQRYPNVDAVAVWRGVIDGQARHVERVREVSPATGQLAIGAVIRVDDKILVPIDKARRLDWVAWFERHETKWREHDLAFAKVRELFESVMRRFRGADDDALTFDVAADLFVDVPAPPR
jgi:hypothetical protein